MKTITELQARFNAIHDALHLHDDDLMGYCVGQLTALLWALGNRPTWTECHIAADEIWDYSRKTRRLLLSALPDQGVNNR
jgi:hypothetical protein